MSVFIIKMLVVYSNQNTSGKLVKTGKFESTLCRSSHRRGSFKKGVLRNFAKFTGKYQWQSLFFNKVAGLRPATLLKKRLLHRCFPVN